MRGEFLDLNVFVSKFYINKSLCFFVCFGSSLFFTEVLSNFVISLTVSRRRNKTTIQTDIKLIEYLVNGGLNEQITTTHHHFPQQSQAQSCQR